VVRSGIIVVLERGENYLGHVLGALLPQVLEILRLRVFFQIDPLVLQRGETFN
jgi:hypothetical protein